MSFFGYHADTHFRKLLLVYIQDWAVVFLLLGLFIVTEFWVPNHRYFYLDDPKIQYPMVEHETVPNILCILLGPITGLVVIAVLSLTSIAISPSGNKDHVGHISVLALSFGCVLSGVITNLLKLWLGNPRPDFISRCIPAEGTPTGVPLTISVCTNTDQAVVQEGFKSTPSGHSSTIFSSMLFLTFWLVGQLSAFRPGTPLYRLAVTLLPLVLALYVASSRTIDFRHSFSDVIAGSLLGSLCAWIAYRKYFPAFTSSNCFEPHILQMQDLPESNTYYYDSESSPDDSNMV